MPDEETLDALIARLLAERLVELGLPPDIARACAIAATPDARGVLVAEVKDGVAIGITTAPRQKALPRARRARR